ncbi:hypothetical protein BJ165DRAFT_1408268 [Panaeolus papilionaceus]|nr:hypothetical protein BJ165DRAFT_1408268 [Panaeolus papilionaceus]
MSASTTSTTAAHKVFPLGSIDHHVLDLSHYQRISPANPDHRDFIVATIQEADNPNKTSYLRLERSRQGTPYSIRDLPHLYQKNPLALCLLYDFLAQNLPRVNDEAQLVFGDVIVALTVKQSDVHIHADTECSSASANVPDLKSRLRDLCSNPGDEGADTVTTIKGHPSPEEAKLIQVAHRSSDHPLSIVFLACFASAAHLFDPIYRLFRQQSFWFAKVLMGVFLADGHVSIVQNELPVRLVKDEVNYGEEGEPKLVKCVVEDLLLDIIHETRVCQDQMFGGFVVECEKFQEDRERAQKLRKKLEDSETWIQEYRFKLEGMLKVFTPLDVSGAVGL